MLIDDAHATAIGRHLDMSPQPNKELGTAAMKVARPGNESNSVTNDRGSLGTNVANSLDYMQKTAVNNSLVNTANMRMEPPSTVQFMREVGGGSINEENEETPNIVDTPGVLADKAAMLG